MIKDKNLCVCKAGYEGFSGANFCEKTKGVVKRCPDDKKPFFYEFNG